MPTMVGEAYVCEGYLVGVGRWRGSSVKETRRLVRCEASGEYQNYSVKICPRT